MDLTRRDRAVVEEAASRSFDADLVRRVSVAVAAALENECRQQQPWAPMRAIYDDKGLRYCCVHKPTRHCTGPLDGES